MVHTMENYSAIKSNKIMKFAGKWTELEETILNWLTQTPIWNAFTCVWILDV